MALLIKISRENTRCKNCIRRLKNNFRAWDNSWMEYIVQCNEVHTQEPEKKKKKTPKISFYNLQLCFKFLVNYFTLKSLPF